MTKPTGSEPLPLPSTLKWLGGLFTLLSVAFAAVLLVRHGGEVGQQWADLQAAGWELRPAWLGASLALFVLNLVVLGLLWVWLLRALGGRLSAISGLRIWSWTNLGRYLPGKVWQLSALAVYMRRQQSSAGIALGSSAALQVLLLATGAGFAVATLGIRLSGGDTATIGAALAVAAGGLLLVLRPGVVVGASAWMARRLGEPEPAASLPTGVVWGVAAGTALSWLLAGLALIALWRGAGGGPGPDLLTWTGAFTTAYLAGYIAVFVPAGMIVREGTLAVLLVSIGGVEGAAAAGIAIAARLWSVVAELLTAALAWMIPVRQPDESEGVAEE